MSESLSTQIHRLDRAFRWWMIELLLNIVVRLVRPDDPCAVPLLEALSTYLTDPRVKEAWKRK